MAKQKNIVLSEAASAQYELAGKPISNRFIAPKFGEVNLSTLTLKQAKSLVDRGFEYLKLKASKKDK